MKIIFSSFLLFFLMAAFNVKTSDKKVIMAVFAHPDDEAVTNVSAVLARYAREGHQVYLVIATKGELGTNQHAKIPAGDSLARVRAGEAICTSEKLGIAPTILLGLGDGGLARDFTGQPLRVKLDSLFHLYLPDVIITWGPDGGYGHMDHRTVHNVVTELAQSGKLKKEPKLFYAGMPTELLDRYSQQNPFKIWMYNNWKTVELKHLTTRIACSKDDLQKSVDAMYCHWSQFTTNQMEETARWMVSTGDTVYLRPFTPVKSISFSLFE